MRLGGPRQLYNVDYAEIWNKATHLCTGETVPGENPQKMCDVQAELQSTVTSTHQSTHLCT